MFYFLSYLKILRYISWETIKTNGFIFFTAMPSYWVSVSFLHMHSEWVGLWKHVSHTPVIFILHYPPGILTPIYFFPEISLPPPPFIKTPLYSGYKSRHLRVKYCSPWSHTSQPLFSMATYTSNIWLHGHLRVKYWSPWSLTRQIFYSMVTHESNILFNDHYESMICLNVHVRVKYIKGINFRVHKFSLVNFRGY